MADVNKTIDIQIKADLKEMLKELKRMPNMAGSEAKKMVNQLKRQFQRAEIAARKQAKAHAQANKRMADSTKQATDSIVRNMDRQVKKSQSLRTQSRALGSTFSGLESIIGEVSPELGGLAATIGTVGIAMRGLARSMATGNPIILAMVVAVGAAAAAYTLFNASTKENEESQNRLRNAIKSTNEQIAQSKKAFEDSEAAMLGNAGKVNQLRAQYQLLTGEITEAEIAEFERAQQASKFADKAQKDFEAQRRALFEQKGAINRQIQAVELRKKELDELGKLRVMQGGVLKLTKEGQNIQAQLDKLQKRRGQISKRQDELKVQGQERVNDAADEYYQLLKDIAIEEAKQEKADKAAARAAKSRAQQQKENQKAVKDAAIILTQELKDEQQNLNELEKVGADARKEASKIAMENEKARISMIDDDVEKINLQMEMEKKLSESRIASLEALKADNLEQADSITSMMAAKAANAEIDKQIQEEREAAAIKEQQYSEQRIKSLKAEREERLALLKTIVSSSVEGANAVAAIIKNVGGENKKAAMVAFRIQQAASLANIAMLTAEKVMAVAPNPLAMTAVGALGALQAGVVLTQSPPEKHMGGVITKGEDTQNITVLDGEAVLDRMTVQRLGGEQGINRLQRGATMDSQVVVMSPFKHFDRYATANIRRGGSLASIANRKASGSY